MVWIQSIICSVLFIANFGWQPKHAAVAVTLNLLLAGSCAWLLLTNPGKKDVDFASRIRSDVIGRAIITGLILLYLGASLVKLNGSSSALWRSFADGEAPVAGVIAGMPKDIRMDEWLVQTPWIWSQINQHPAFPSTNRNVGNGPTPLLTNLPVRHWTMSFRPQMWGFFFLKPERAFAFNWNFKWFGILLGGFLFLRIVARGDNFLALNGAMLILFSSYVQWFFSTPTCMPEMIAMVFFGLWATAMLFRARSVWAVAGAGLVLLIAIEQFIFCCYPRFQVPLAYLALALLIAGWAIHRRRSEGAPVLGGYYRAGFFIALLALAAAITWQWYSEVSIGINEVQSLVYPGKATSTGGAFRWYFFLAPFLEFSMSQDHFPSPFPNVCEAAGFLFIAPVLAAILIRDALWKRTDAILLSIVLLLVFAVLFMVYGFPQWLAEATGWNYTKSSRAVLVVGVATMVGLVRHLALTPQSHGPKKLMVAIAIPVALVLFGCFYAANGQMRNFATLAEVSAAAIFFATAFWLLWCRVRIATCLLLLIPCLYSYGLVNPISRGLPGMTESGVFRWLGKIHKTEPQALWIVTGNLTNRTCFLAQLVKATGANVLGGTRCMPDRKMLGVLDPEDRYRFVHDRYARICFQVSTDASPDFKLYFGDYYLVRLPLEAQLLQQLGIDYALVVDQGEFVTPAGYERVGEREGCVLLHRLASR